MRKTLIVLLGLIIAGNGTYATEITKMRTEQLTNPLGIDNLQPRFSWQLKDAGEGACQRSYRIRVSRDSAAFKSAVIWDSGTIESSDVMAQYSGDALDAFTKYWWNVSVEDNTGQLLESEVAFFEMGMMSRSAWRGYWISDSNDRDFKAAPRFRKEFNTGNKELASARAYIAAAGIYTLHLNGRRVGRNMLEPAFTRYDKRILYTTYDITALLRSGENAVGVELGNGWYNHQARAVWNFHNAPWRARPCFCMDIHIKYTDGSSEVISSSPDWKTSTDGPCTYNNIYVGEHHDLRKQQHGWSLAGYDDNMWNAVTLRTCPTEIICAEVMAPIRLAEEIQAKEITVLKPTRLLYDFGNNQAGNAHLRIKGPKGTKVSLKYSERKTDDDRADQSNIAVYYTDDATAWPFQTDIIILSGEDDDFIPEYSYKGFRYIEVNSSAPLDWTKESLTAVCLHSDVASAGAIKASDPLINKINAAARRSYLSNLMGYPTDCPQREKNGWTGDGHIALQTGLYNFDAITVYEKWLADHRDEQQPNGVLPDIIPTGGWGYWAPESNGNGLDWTSTIALIPWNLYLFTGDAKALKDNYDNIKRYVEYALTLTKEGLCSWGRGDWVPVSTRSNKTLVCSCFLYKDLCILAQAAALLGKEADEARYNELAAYVRNAINSSFLNTETGIYADGMQTDLSLPLYFEVAGEEMAPKIAAALAKKVAADGYHINAGVHGAKAVLNVLSAYGYADAAYKIASAKDYPGWGWWMKNGHSTLLENWRLDAARDISDNHIMFGDISAWFYRSLGGVLPDPDAPGFKHIILRPNFPKGLKSFECSHESPYGTIHSSWQRKQRKIDYSVTIPCSATATLYLPDGSTKELKSGSYRLTIK